MFGDFLASTRMSRFFLGVVGDGSSRPDVPDSASSASAADKFKFAAGILEMRSPPLKTNPEILLTSPRGIVLGDSKATDRV